MENFTPVASLLGGILIGLSSVFVLLSQGRIAGISGMCGALLQRGEGMGWRAAFLAGLLSVGVVAWQVAPDSLSLAGAPGSAGLIAGGLLVGFGTRLGNGCTSGHGVCGVSRLSPRSIAATGTFMAVGALTVFVVRHVLGGV